MGTVFEKRCGASTEENNEEAGEHWTPRDAVRLMTRLMFEPIADKIPSGTYRLYDGAMGTGGMLTVAEETLKQLHRARRQTGLHAPLRPGDQRRDLRHREGRPDPQRRRPGGRQHHRWPRILDTLERRVRWPSSTSCSPIRPTAKRKTDQDRLGGAKKIIDPRFIVTHDGDGDYSLVTRSSDGQLMFLANLISKMKQSTALGSHIASVHNGSSLFTGDAGQGEQFPPLDHRERLARSDRRPAAEDVLQHWHRHLHG